MYDLPKHRLTGDASRFVLAGLFNTALTFLIYQMLLFPLSAPLAYAGSWITGLGFVAFFYPANVFKGSRRGIGDRLLLAGSYCGVLVAGLLLLNLLQELGVIARIAIIPVTVATTIVNFTLSQVILCR